MAVTQTYLGYPFDQELFSYLWGQEVDPTLIAILQSGAMQDNAYLRSLISNGSDFYTLPFYKTIGGDPANYDGQTDIPVTDPDGGHQSGIVYGRSKAWRELDFIVDYNSGARPMQQIVSQVARYWQHRRQAAMIGILKAIYGVTGTGDFAGWENHKTVIASADTTVGAANKLGPTTIGDAIQKAVGDNGSIFSMAILHSRVAQNLANQNLLEYRKYTDIQGIERQLRIADINGMTVVIDDGVPTTAAGAAAETYTSYLFGPGALQYAPAPVKVPSEVERSALVNGGEDVLATRIRETIHPNGFSFTKPATGYTSSPTDAQLFASANWSIAMNPKNIAMAQIVSNG